MPKDDNIFTFDVAPFINGLNKIGKGIGAMTKNASEMASNVSKGVTSAIAKIGLLAGAFKLVKNAISEMPEIGKAFDIAKNIITKNLLYPLRQAVFPLLQKFLNWVRDNRAMFVKWGQTLANIFQTVVSSIGGIINIGEKLFNKFLNFINKAFGSNIKNLQDILNILTFKFSVVFEFLKTIMKPLENILDVVFDIAASLIKDVLDNITKIVSSLLQITDNGNSIFTIFKSIAETFGIIAKWASEIVSSFIDGFIPFIAPMLDSIQKIADGFKSIFTSIFGSNEAMKTWKDLFQFLGDVVGGVLAGAFAAIAQAIESIDKLIKGDFAGAFESFLKIFGGPGPNPPQGNPYPKQNDAIVTSDGKVIPVDSKDDIVAFKPGGPISSLGGSNIIIDFSGMQLIIQEATPAEAKNFSEKMVDTFRDTLARELERQGLR